MSLQLIIFLVFGFLFCIGAIAFYIWGSIQAVKMLKATFKVEELAKSYGLDYSIKNKAPMYVICVLGSWLAYSALSKVGYEEKKDD